MPHQSVEELTMQQEIEHLSILNEKLLAVHSISPKINHLLEDSRVNEYLTSSNILKEYLKNTTPENQLALLSILALNQGPVVFRGLEEVQDPSKTLEKLLDQVKPVTTNYQGLGGIIGYHLTILKLIQESQKHTFSTGNTSYLKPEGFDISYTNEKVKEYIRAGIEALPYMAEVYPVGGAGDRLSLIDHATGVPLPTAKLEFCGRSLLVGLFEDLAAREFLYYELTGKQVITPVALMTSHEKNNHSYILDICEKNQWFGRPKESIRYFNQPMVPVVTVEGNWCLTGPLQLRLKPGGHGVIWKLALEAGIFDWFHSQNRKKMLIRQINNPIAGTDYGLLAFIGCGFKENKSFGFASCPRLLNSPEGMNLIIETKEKENYRYCLTNLEYTDFAKRGIKDISEKPGSPYSALPSNTNILFADIATLIETAQNYPIPGLLINMKTAMPYINPEGNVTELPASRLESTMQNVADYITDEFSEPLSPGQFSQLKSYLTYNQRRKTISVTKSLYKPGKEMAGTPEGCLYEKLENYSELLREYCGFKLPQLNSHQEYLENGPPFYIYLHPAIGPLYSVIAQKIRKGQLHPHAELQLDIAEIDIENLNLEGSLKVITDSIVGEEESSEQIRYGNRLGKCTLRNVTIKNLGLDYAASKPIWMHQSIRHEEVLIYLEDNSEFIAENITFHGQHQIRVPTGKRMIAYQEGYEVKFKLENTSNKRWHYHFNKSNDIILNKV